MRWPKYWSFSLSTIPSKEIVMDICLVFTFLAIMGGGGAVINILAQIFTWTYIFVLGIHLGMELLGHVITVGLPRWC